MKSLWRVEKQERRRARRHSESFDTKDRGESGYYLLVLLPNQFHIFWLCMRPFRIFAVLFAGVRHFIGTSKFVFNHRSLKHAHSYV
jgi:hypothetical protein